LRGAEVLSQSRPCEKSGAGRWGPDWGWRGVCWFMAEPLSVGERVLVGLGDQY